MLDGKVKNVMVRFDLSKEQFGRIGLPENVATLPCICVAAEVYLELLAVVAVDMNSRYSIWTMKEGNGDIQVMRTRGRSYGEWKAVDPEGRPCNYGYYYMFGENHKLVNSCYASPFVESLAFLDASTDFDDAPNQNSGALLEAPSKIHILVEREAEKMPLKVLDATVATFNGVFEKFKAEAPKNKANFILFLADIDPSTSLSWCPARSSSKPELNCPQIERKLHLSSDLQVPAWYLLVIDLRRQGLSMTDL
nr:thioredoxin-like protein Clot [Ipomoea batatas]